MVYYFYMQWRISIRPILIVAMASSLLLALLPFSSYPSDRMVRAEVTDTEDFPITDPRARPTPTAPVGSDQTPTIKNPLGSVADPRVLLGKIIGAALGVVGSLALVVFLYGGFTWMTSGGNPDRVRHGRDLIVWAAIGLFVIFASYAMVRFVLETVAQNSGAVR